MQIVDDCRSDTEVSSIMIRSPELSTLLMDNWASLVLKYEHPFFTNRASGMIRLSLRVLIWFVSLTNSILVFLSPPTAADLFKFGPSWHSNRLKSLLLLTKNWENVVSFEVWSSFPLKGWWCLGLFEYFKGWSYWTFIYSSFVILLSRFYRWDSSWLVAALFPNLTSSNISSSTS